MEPPGNADIDFVTRYKYQGCPNDDPAVQDAVIGMIRDMFKESNSAFCFLFDVSILVNRFNIILLEMLSEHLKKRAERSSSYNIYIYNIDIYNKIDLIIFSFHPLSFHFFFLNSFFWLHVEKILGNYMQSINLKRNHQIQVQRKVSFVSCLLLSAGEEEREAER